jgi:hypothetical protein
VRQSAPDLNSLGRGVSERMLEDVERLLRRRRQLEGHAGAAVLDGDRQGIRQAAPEQRDLDAVGRAVMELCVGRFRHVFTVAVSGVL